MTRRHFAVAAALALAATPALAHEQSGVARGLASGFVHPISGWDHVLAMVAVGLWGAQLGRPALWLLPVAFPMMMACGGLVALLGLPLPGVEIGIALSAVALGALVAAEAKPPLAAALAIVALFALFHGHAHGAELAPGANAIAYSLGFVAATGLLHAVGILIGAAHRWRAGRAAVRAAGVLVAAGGAWFLWRALR